MYFVPYNGLKKGRRSYKEGGFWLEYANVPTNPLTTRSHAACRNVTIGSGGMGQIRILQTFHHDAEQQA